MKRKQLGRSALRVSPLCFGGNVLGWTVDERRSFEILDAFTAAGFSFIDTADVYSRWAGEGGESETILGKWMKSRNNRKDLVIATKVGMEMGSGKSGLSKKYILKAVEDSLKRLQTDYIDLYQSHKDDLATPVEETLQAYQQLIAEGKIKFIGASNFSAARLQEALDASAKFNLPRYESLQPHYNLCERKKFEGDLEKVCRKNELGVITYYSLASGFLTGKYRSLDDTATGARGRGASKYLNASGKRILKALDEIAASHKSKPASVALAWLMAKPSVTAPIASATSVTQLGDLINATKLELSVNDIELLDRASDEI
jgi:aryl-alcohol dehydrogenase-like predicted oxidoreductase